MSKGCRSHYAVRRKCLNHLFSPAVPELGEPKRAKIAAGVGVAKESVTILSDQLPQAQAQHSPKGQSVNCSTEIGTSPLSVRMLQDTEKEDTGGKEKEEKEEEKEKKRCAGGGAGADRRSGFCKPLHRVQVRQRQRRGGGRGPEGWWQGADGVVGGGGRERERKGGGGGRRERRREGERERGSERGSEGARE